MFNETFQRRSVLAMMLTLVVAVAGCSGEQQAEVAMRRACLSRLGEVYHEFHTTQKRSPAGLEEFAESVLELAKEDDEIANELAKRMQEGDIIVFWNAKLRSDGQDDGSKTNADHVLAFEASCPGNGGYMVTVGGTVDHVTAKKFGEMTEVAHAEAE